MPDLQTDIIRFQSELSEQDIATVIRDIRDVSFENVFDEPIPWDKWDWVMIAIASGVGALSDLVLGRPSGFKEPHVSDDALFGLGKKINQYDLKNNPIDFQEPGAFGGDHRLYSRGHDLFRFFDGVRQTMAGEYRGISSVGWGEMVKQYPGYATMDFKTALIVNLLHLFKDFWTARSLPIPGMTVLADLNNQQMPKLAEDLYTEHGVNLRTISGQAFSVGSIELMLRVYVFLRYRNSEFRKEQIVSKRNKLLLTSHSVAMLFNLGKVVVTQNPFMLNVPQLLMIAKYCFGVLKEGVELHIKHIEATHELAQGNSRLVLQLMSSARVYSDISREYQEMLLVGDTMVKSKERQIMLGEEIKKHASETSDHFSESIRRLT